VSTLEPRILKSGATGGEVTGPLSPAALERLLQTESANLGTLRRQPFPPGVPN
jgi:hypothetical protein